MKIYLPNKDKLAIQNSDALLTKGVVLIDAVSNTVADIGKQLGDAEIIIANYITLDANRLKALPKLRHIIVPSVGYDWVDVPYANSQGVTVSNCPHFSTDTVAEHAVALTLSVLRNVSNEALTTPQTLSGATIGYIGYGKIAKRIEKLLAGFDTKALSINSRSTESEILNTFSQADVLISTLPSTPETKNFISDNRLRTIKPGASFINVGRGDTVDEDALVTALLNGSVRSVGLDVIKNELTVKPDEHPLISLPQVTFTPHIAYLSGKSIQLRDEEIVSVIESCIAKSPINLVS